MPLNMEEVMWAIASRMGMLTEDGQDLKPEFKRPREVPIINQRYTTEDGRVVRVLDIVGLPAHQLVMPVVPRNNTDLPGLGLSENDAREVLKKIGREPEDEEGFARAVSASRPSDPDEARAAALIPVQDPAVDPVSQQADQTMGSDNMPATVRGVKRPVETKR